MPAHIWSTRHVRLAVWWSLGATCRLIRIILIAAIKGLHRLYDLDNASLLKWYLGAAITSPLDKEQTLVRFTTIGDTIPLDAYAVLCLLGSRYLLWSTIHIDRSRSGFAWDHARMRNTDDITLYHITCWPTLIIWLWNTRDKQDVKFWRKLGSVSRYHPMLPIDQLRCLLHTISYEGRRNDSSCIAYICHDTIFINATSANVSKQKASSACYNGCIV
jgi:hypothetical protein